MHYTTRVQIAQEAQIAQGPTFESMMQATNAVQIEAQITGAKPVMAEAMSTFLRNLALSAPHLRRANTFPGSKPNRNEVSEVSLRTGALAQRPISAEIPATGAGQLSEAFGTPCGGADALPLTRQIFRESRDDGLEGLKSPSQISAEEAA